MKQYAYKRYANVQMEPDGGALGQPRLVAGERRFEGLQAYQNGDRLVLTYTGVIDADDSKQAAEQLYERHNRDDRPDGRTGPSLSVGDVVVLLECWQISDPAVAYACGSLGWNEVPVPTNIDPRFWVEVMNES